MQEGTDNASGEVRTMSIQTAKPCAEPSNDVDRDSSKKMKNGKATGKI
jgi:hypothetical protein